MPERTERKERGIASIEYGVMVLMIALAFTFGLGAVGTALNSMFQLAADTFP